MKRTAQLLFSIALLSLAVKAQPSDAGKAPINTVQVAPNFYIIESKAADTDISVYVNDEGLVVVDTGLEPLAPRLREAIRKISPKPIKYVLLTHYHYDHIGGAELFAREAPIIAQENTRKRMMKPSHIDGRNDSPAPLGALPSITFDKQLSLYLNGEEILLLAAQAHTDSDAVIWFTRANIVHMGDAIFGPDNDGGGDIHGVITICERVASLVPADAKVIVGHIGVVSVDDVRQQGKQWAEATAIMEKAIKQGKSLQQIKDEKLLATVIKGNPDRVADKLYVNLKATAAKP